MCSYHASETPDAEWTPSQYVVIREGAAIFELLAGKNQPLLIWRNDLLVLDLGLDILN